MTSNLPGTSSAPSATEPVVTAAKSASPVTNPTGVNGVAVYDQEPDKGREPSVNSSVSVFDSAPKSQSSGNVIAWVIGIVVLIVLVYFLLQYLT